MQKRTFLSMLVAGAVSVPLSSHAAWAPSGEVSVIVAYKAGSGTDVGARLLASEAEKFVGRPLVVNNVPGADGKIGWREAGWPHDRLHQSADLHDSGRSSSLPAFHLQDRSDLQPPEGNRCRCGPC